MPLTRDRHLTGRLAAPITVVLRYDDFSNGSPDGLDRYLFEVAMDAGVALTVAALPFGDGPEESRGGPAGEPEPLSERKARILAPFLARGGPGRIELAQHGFDHEPAGRDPLGRPAELSGLPVDEQRARIERGLEILEHATGVRPRSFVPPWNRFDASTVAVLRELGFSVLSAGRDAPERDRSSDPEDGAMAFVPATAPPHRVRNAIHDARERGGGVIVALLHPYDFVELDTPWGRFDRAEFRAWLDWMASQPDVRTVTLGELPSIEPDLGLARFEAFGRFHASPLARCVPPRAEGSVDRPLRTYPDSVGLRGLARRRAATAFAIFVASAGAGAGLGALLDGAGSVVGLGAAVPIALAALAAGIGWRSARAGGPWFRGIWATWALACSALGAWVL